MPNKDRITRAGSLSAAPHSTPQRAGRASLFPQTEKQHKCMKEGVPSHTGLLWAEAEFLFKLWAQTFLHAPELLRGLW